MFLSKKSVKLIQCPNCGPVTAKACSPIIQDYEYGTLGEWQYFSCENCGLAVLSPLPSIQELIAAYPNEYHTNNNINSSNKLRNILLNLFMKLYVRKFNNKLKNARVLDVGCGSSNLLSFLKDRYNIDETGIDFSPHAVRLGKSKGLHLINTLFLDYKPQSRFDFIIMNNYIEHTLDPMLELKHACSLLEEDGVLLGLLPNFDSWDRNLLGRYWGGYHCPRHTFQFKPSVLKKMLFDAGFADCTISNELHGAHISIGISNYLLTKNSSYKKTDPKNKADGFKKIAFFNILTIACTPISILFALFNKNGAIKFSAQHPQRHKITSEPH